MYKLFLCIRYLCRRPIALVAITGTTLCVFMVLVVTSVMNGFLDTVEKAARGMMGDVIVDPYTVDNIPDYQPFIERIEKEFPGAQATPVIYTAGLLRLESYTQLVRVVGLRMPEAAEVTSFARGLRHRDPALPGPTDFTIPPKMRERFEAEALLAQRDLAATQEARDGLQAELDLELDKEQPDERLVAYLRSRLDSIDAELARIRQRIRRPNQPGVIIGIDLPGLNRRDPVTGEDHPVVPDGQTLTLTVLPLGGGGTVTAERAISPAFTLVGYSRMGIYQIDREFVYVDFDLLQQLLDLDAQPGLVGRPGRCSQIMVKFPGANESQLAHAAGAIEALWDSMPDRTPGADIIAQTWRQKQQVYIGSIEKQRTLMIIMFGVISLVAVVLVFAIFYMMVVQKTKDIGIVKSIGGSSGGVAGIFLLYGAAVGVVGSAVGVAAGWLFVWRINPIHDWIARVFNWRVFDRESYLFDKIPNQVQLSTVVAVIVGAILAGLIGAIIPAWRAARMQPVEALSYE